MMTTITPRQALDHGACDAGVAFVCDLFGIPYLLGEDDYREDYIVVVNAPGKDCELDVREVYRRLADAEPVDWFTNGDINDAMEWLVEAVARAESDLYRVYDVYRVCVPHSWWRLSATAQRTFIDAYYNVRDRVRAELERGLRA